MKKIQRRRTILLIIGILVAVFCLMLFAMSIKYEVKIRPKNAEDLLNRDYYDFTDSAVYHSPEGIHDYTFFISGKEMRPADVHALTEEEYRTFTDAVPELVYAVWDENADRVDVFSEEEGRARNLKVREHGMYMLDSGQNGIILILAHKTIMFFEQWRPLAFYLIEEKE